MIVKGLRIIAFIVCLLLPVYLFKQIVEHYTQQGCAEYLGNTYLFPLMMFSYIGYYAWLLTYGWHQITGRKY